MCCPALAPARFLIGDSKFGNEWLPTPHNTTPVSIEHVSKRSDQSFPHLPVPNIYGTKGLINYLIYWQLGAWFLLLVIPWVSIEVSTVTATI